MGPKFATRLRAIVESMKPVEGLSRDDAAVIRLKRVLLKEIAALEAEGGARVKADGQTKASDWKNWRGVE